MNEREFNLLYEPWVMVLTQEGKMVEVSLLTALERAHVFRGLAGELPTQDVAILRLLLATLYATFTRVDTHGNRNPIETANEALERWESIWKLGRFPFESIKRRLCHYEERFYLFHPTRPFYQVANLDKGTNYSTAKLLGNISESSNKVRLFPIRTGEMKRTLTFAEASRWLLYLNAFDDTSSKPSIRGQKMLSPGAGWLGKLGLIYATGTSLFETLMFNFVLLNDNGDPWNSGKAIWEIDDPRIDERVEIAIPHDPLTLLTLQSRRILLQRDRNKVTGYQLLGGDFFQKENAFTEQMTLWRKDIKEDVYTPKRHDPTKQLWRDFSALLADEDNQKKSGIIRWISILTDLGHLNKLITFQIAGVKYGDKDFFVTNVFQDSLSINSNILSQFEKYWVTRITRLIAITEECVNHIFFLAVDLAKASGGSDSLHRKAGYATGNAARVEAYFMLDMPFRRWLAVIDPAQTDIDTAEQDWKDTVKRLLIKLGKEMTDLTGEKGIVGRWVNKRLYTAPGAFVEFCSKIKNTLKKGG
ncbi:MAG: type I-E CRISPR-associated protein Cse1/CasA [Acetivibrionales bacterium]|jgi:CRISPR system Cascade subunit CasA